MQKLVGKIIGKKNFIISKEVPLTYIIKRGLLFAESLLRGKIRSFGLLSNSQKLSIGRNVTLFCKSKMTFGNNVRIEDRVYIDALSENGIVFGDNVKIGSNSKVICSGSISNLGKGLIIGNQSYFSENSFFGCAGGVKIGDNVIAGQNVRFHSENHNFDDIDTLIMNQGTNQRGITIGSNIWIGSGVVFLDGAIVEDGCVIGANSIVNGHFETNSIIVGIPAKKIRKR